MAVLWEFFDHRRTSLVISLVVLSVNRRLLVSPRLERLRKTIYSHASQFRLHRQMLMVGQHISHEVAKQVIALAGHKVTIHQHPAGTQPGTVFRLKGKGIKSIRGNRKGDLYVKVSLEVPTKLNGKQKKAIQAMRDVVTDECYHKKSGFLSSIKEFFS